MTLDVRLRHAIGGFELDAAFATSDGISVLFGPSGAGKSLMLRLIAGIDRPTEGRITRNGTCFVDTATAVWTSPQDRRIGMVFQDPLLLPHRTALGNVALAVREGSRSERRHSALSWLERVDASSLVNRHPGDISGGQAQRVALARALAGRPRLLLLDEPFNALDQPVRRQLRALLRSVVDRHRVPALFVTHDAEEAVELADQLIVAEPGRIRAADPARSITAAIERSLDPS